MRSKCDTLLYDVGGEFVFWEFKNLSEDASNDFFPILRFPMFDDVLNDIVSTNETLDVEMLYPYWSRINDCDIRCNSSNTGFCCSWVQCSRTLCTTRHPYGWLAIVATWPLKESTMNCTCSGATLSIAFCTTWFPFWSLTQRRVFPSSSLMRAACWSGRMYSSAFWTTRQPYIWSDRRRTWPCIWIASAVFWTWFPNSKNFWMT